MYVFKDSVIPFMHDKIKKNLDQIKCVQQTED